MYFFYIVINLIYTFYFIIEILKGLFNVILHKKFIDESGKRNAYLNDREFYALVKLMKYIEKMNFDGIIYKNI